MRGASHLKDVSAERSGVPVKKEHNTEGSWLEQSRIPHLLEEMERMTSEMFRRPFAGFNTWPGRGLFGDFAGRGEVSPAVDVFEDEGTICVRADLPGMSKKDIEVKLVGNTLEITGEKKTETKVDQRDFLRLERSYGKFSRTVRLPEGLKGDHVAASFENGVLEVRIPKAEDKRIVQHIAVK